MIFWHQNNSNIILSLWQKSVKKMALVCVLLMEIIEIHVRFSIVLLMSAMSRSKMAAKWRWEQYFRLKWAPTLTFQIDYCNTLISATTHPCQTNWCGIVQHTLMSHPIHFWGFFSSGRWWQCLTFYLFCGHSTSVPKIPFLTTLTFCLAPMDNNDEQS